MKNTLFLLLSLSILTSCDDLLLGEEVANTPENNFKSLWSEFDIRYGQFPIRGIDWDSVYTTNISRAQSTTSDEALYELMVEMLDPLNDGHVALIPIGTTLPDYHGGPIGKLDAMSDFELDVVKDNYLQEVKSSGDFFNYGYVANGIGYLHIEGFSDLAKFFEEPMNEVISYFKNADGLIIDVRGGYGGEDVAGQYIAGYFMNEKRPYMITKIKAGPEHQDFTDPVTWYVQAEGDQQFLKPVVVLTHRFTISARESFCLAMKVSPNVTFMGDTTAGAFSNQINRELPNGWAYSLSIGDWRDANNTSHEGIGLIPDVLVQNTREELLNGKDNVLEEAISFLEGKST